MDIILHIGAHRSGTTSFQHYLRDSHADLSEQSIGYWGPARTRQSVFPGLFPKPAAARGRNLCRRAEGRVQMQVAQCLDRGVTHLLVSDENMIGSSCHSLRQRKLYPAIGERMARIGSAFGGSVSRVVLSTRAQDLWWASAAAYTVARGHRVPDAAAREEIARSPRGWRDVITDLACALPEADIRIAPFEQYAGRADALLNTCLDIPAPAPREVRWLNRSPNLPALRRALVERGEDPAILPDDTGRWQPFSAAQVAALQEQYADDLFWLTAGADGLATLTEDPTRKRAGISPPPGDMTRGQSHDIRPQERQGTLAPSG
tara:strand:- start:32841 stop:33794 length:954 start_codon:yes stop_codon:yes gene_type:complete